MAQRKELRDRDPKRMRADHTPEDDRSDDDVEHDKNRALLPAVFMTDDLTKAGASFTYQARVLKRNHKIQDTWVINCLIMAKDTHRRISHDEYPLQIFRNYKMKINLKYWKPTLIALVDYYCIMLLDWNRRMGI